LVFSLVLSKDSQDWPTQGIPFRVQFAHLAPFEEDMTTQVRPLLKQSKQAWVAISPRPSISEKSRLRLREGMEAIFE